MKECGPGRERSYVGLESRTYLEKKQEPEVEKIGRKQKSFQSGHAKKCYH